ncbi:MAG: hypothetical protein ACR5LD_04730 [Symbiopectobacterium sp.]
MTQLDCVLCVTDNSLRIEVDVGQRGKEGARDEVIDRMVDDI